METIIEKAYKIAKKYGLEKYLEEIEAFVGHIHKNRLPRNDHLWDAKFLRFCRCLSFKPLERSCLCFMYHRPCSTKEIAILTLSAQSAKPVEQLRKMGFIFSEEAASNGPRYIKNGIREIIGLGKPTPITPQTKCKRMDLFRKQVPDRDPLTMAHQYLEVDHRRPVSVCFKLGIKPAILTDELIQTGKAGLEFQFLSKTTNALKREACKKCQNGDEIPLPDAITNNGYKKQWNGKCEGCFYFDYRLPQTSK